MPHTPILTPSFQNADNDISGEALVALLHDDLKSMGIVSVGHRLTILKSVYDVKKAQDVPIENDHYVPLCMSPNDAHTPFFVSETVGASYEAEH